MLFDQLQLEALKSQLVQKHSEQGYVSKSVEAMAKFTQAHPWNWKHFGPYWPQVQALLLRDRPDLAPRVREWGDPPDYLSHYSYGDDMLNAIAALQYLNRDGDHMAPVGHPHSIELADGSMALYSPDLGIIES